MTTTLISDTGKEPVLKEAGTVLDTRVESEPGRTNSTSHRLDQLGRDYYLFSVSPVYFVTGFSCNIVQLFLQEVGALDTSVMVFMSATHSPVFSGTADWCRMLLGLPWEVVTGKINDRTNIFKVFATSVELADPVKQRRDYWVVDVVTVNIPTPGVVSVPVPVDIYVPSGYNFKLRPYVQSDGTIGFVKEQPDDDVRARALAVYAEGL